MSEQRSGKTFEGEMYFTGCGTDVAGVEAGSELCLQSINMQEGGRLGGEGRQVQERLGHRVGRSKIKGW